MKKICMGDQPTCPARSSASWTEWGLTDSIWGLMEDCWERSPADRPTISDVKARIDSEKPFDHRPGAPKDILTVTRLRLATFRGDTISVDSLKTLLTNLNSLLTQTYSEPVSLTLRLDH